TPRRISPFVWWDLGGLNRRPEGGDRGHSGNEGHTALVGGGWRHRSAHFHDLLTGDGRLLVDRGDELAPQPPGGRPDRWGEVHRAYHEMRLDEARPAAVVARRTAVFLERHEGDRHEFQYQSLAVDSRPGQVVRVRRQVDHIRLAGRRDWLVNHDRFYHWWN